MEASYAYLEEAVTKLRAINTSTQSHITKDEADARLSDLDAMQKAVLSGHGAEIGIEDFDWVERQRSRLLRALASDTGFTNARDDEQSECVKLGGRGPQNSPGG